ncbi:hypothetical protein SLEP1_g53710 [Rubroshorea leprosula]|uniref:Uncharacterized protein n=1 Tax=Rubroshorea leprosula TaxID=152421 RepID=A0AAV5MA40_9ROSI|nr:hypothetical protein SLEP1_g53710 [Rubroshorea leprosula]
MLEEERSLLNEDSPHPQCGDRMIKFKKGQQMFNKLLQDVFGISHFLHTDGGNISDAQIHLFKIELQPTRLEAYIQRMIIHNHYL